MPEVAQEDVVEPVALSRVLLRPFELEPVVLHASSFPLITRVAQVGTKPLDMRAGRGQAGRMIFGAHMVIFSSDADADRAFISDVLGFEHVDAGSGWLIFGLPPAELAVHPAAGPGGGLYLMCDDLAVEIGRLAGLGVACSAVEEARWGSVTMIPLPGGGEIGLYQPRHETMIERG
jgi:catechol 2,3-dioxygenase-like lactoylglutathione lyase family enzyme